MFRERIISIISFCLYLAAVAYLCFAKPEDVPHLPEYWFGIPADKLGHLLMFMPFPFLGYLAFSNEETNLRRKVLLLTGLLAAGAAIAVATEQVQALLQYRTADIDDLVADAIGIFCGGVATFIYITLKKRT